VSFLIDGIYDADGVDCLHQRKNVCMSLGSSIDGLSEVAWSVEECNL